MVTKLFWTGARVTYYYRGREKGRGGFTKLTVSNFYCINITKAVNLTAGTGQACTANYCKTRTLCEMSYTCPELLH